MQNQGKFIQIGAYLLIIVALVFILGIARNCADIKNYGEQIGHSRGDTLDIGMLYGPSSMYMEADTFAGLNHNLAMIYSRQTGIPVKIWPVADVVDAMNKTQSGAFDILASLPMDNEIKKNFLPTESLFLDRLVLLQLRDSITGEIAVSSSLDLKGKTVYVPLGSPAAKRLENLAKEIGGEINIIEEPELSDELIAIKVGSGQIPLAVINERIAQKVSANYPSLSYDNPVSFTQFQVWLFNRNDTLQYKKFYDWFENFRTTDSYRELITGPETY